MRPEHRKHRRQELRYRAYVDLCDGTPFHPCQLVDVSENGAQLSVTSADAVPDQFVLLLAMNGSARRRCLVIWRSDTRIGIRFVTTLSTNRSRPTAKPRA